MRQFVLCFQVAIWCVSWRRQEITNLLRILRCTMWSKFVGVISRVANWTSTWANHIGESEGQSGEFWCWWQRKYYWKHLNVNLSVPQPISCGLPPIQRITHKPVWQKGWQESRQASFIQWLLLDLGIPHISELVKYHLPILQNKTIMKAIYPIESTTCNYLVTTPSVKRSIIKANEQYIRSGHEPTSVDVHAHEWQYSVPWTWSGLLGPGDHSFQTTTTQPQQLSLFTRTILTHERNAPVH